MAAPDAAEVQDVARPTKLIVGPDDQRGWEVTREGERGSLAVTAKKPDAVRAARIELQRLGGGELEIRRRDGTIQEARTIGVPENLGSPG